MCSSRNWVVQAFDAGEGVVVGTLPRVREGIEVSPQAAREAD